jgi:nucleoside-diphosphate-sugar epimerase
MKVLITGGSGYIGQATIRSLRKRGHDVAALVRSDAAAKTVADLGAVPIDGTITDAAAVHRAASAADGAIHLAMVRGPLAAKADLIAATAIQDAIGSGPYVHTGGTWVYGNTTGVVDESAPWGPPPIVAWREQNERQILDRAATGGHPVLVMPGVVYGAGAGLVENFFIVPARERGSVRYIGAGSNHWSLVHVDDIAALYALALEAPAGAVYAGVGEYRYTVADLLPAMSTAAGCAGGAESMSLEEARAGMGPIADAFALDQQVSGGRARAELGWNPPERDLLEELAQGDMPA